MKKTFDQLFNEIVGENLMQAASAQQQTQSQQTQAQQPQQGQQQPTNLKEIATQLAGINKAEEIEAILNKLINPNAANQPA